MEDDGDRPTRTDIPSERGHDPVDPAHAGLASSPELDDDVVVTPPDTDDEPGAGAR